MNKEYKLIKKYPSLPNDWEVGMIVGMGDRNFGYSPCAGNYSDSKKLDNSEVENNPEFWTVYVEPLEYKVLSLEHKDLPFYYKLSYNNYFPDIKPSTIDSKTLNELLSCGWYIRQIERLSDGEIFTLGDKIFNDFIINKITLEFNNILVGAINSKKEGGCWNLKNVIKHKVLFTTIDNVEIFTGDEFYVVDTRFFKTHKTIGGHFTKDKPNYKRFKEQSNAEDYVIHNKPVLTLKEVQKILNGHLLFNNHIGIELDKSLLNLVKEKLNLQ